ncbi:hypothetical protein [Campylobacter gastrosuis]|uniref:Uncharacterized protein n=1 Tax=Campylobacter gastrosuis TaxID=2974576 RepID=A0ABT7HSD1_9BACT|nr:hypothetical protein [Campylobacter gastrosuis]MDL0089600.1 hypothetical protein [Campylobacter gastrosuis]
MFLKNGVIFKIGSSDEAVNTHNLNEIYGIRAEIFKEFLQKPPQQKHTQNQTINHKRR